MSVSETDEFEQARQLQDVMSIIADERDAEQLEAAGWKLIGLARKAQGRCDLPQRSQEVLDE